MDAMIHLVRFLRHTATFLFILLPLMIAGWILLLITLPYIRAEQRFLPRWLRWFDNADQYVGRDTSVYYMICDSGWWNRYTWLAWRNPINYFHYVYMGLKWKGGEAYLDYDPAGESVGDSSSDHPGFRHIEVRQNGLHYFEYYWIYRYPFKRDVCFRYRLGWKISDTKNPPGTISQWVFVISPWKKYSGR